MYLWLKCVWQENMQKNTKCDDWYIKHIFWSTVISKKLYVKAYSMFTMLANSKLSNVCKGLILTKFYKLTS